MSRMIAMAALLAALAACGGASGGHDAPTATASASVTPPPSLTPMPTASPTVTATVARCPSRQPTECGGAVLVCDNRCCRCEQPTPRPSLTSIATPIMTPPVRSESATPTATTAAPTATAGDGCPCGARCLLGGTVPGECRPHPVSPGACVCVELIAKPTPTPTCAPTGTPYSSDHCQPCPTIREGCYASACGQCIPNPTATPTPSPTATATLCFGGASVSCGTDLRVQLSADDSRLFDDSELDYRIVVMNRSADRLADVTMIDKIEFYEEGSFPRVAVETSQGSCNGYDSVTCLLGDLDPNASATIDIHLSAIFRYLRYSYEAGIVATVSAQGIGPTEASLGTHVRPQPTPPAVCNPPHVDPVTSPTNALTQRVAGTIDASGFAPYLTICSEAGCGPSGLPSVPPQGYRFAVQVPLQPGVLNHVRACITEVFPLVCSRCTTTDVNGAPLDILQTSATFTRTPTPTQPPEVA
ncbi:MAG: hypothetical protein HYR72_09015 [Deltaproteobacteria bacterium]|nr:hypothetical protein [Deltaproteobacteria bacterium]MBI3388897.1 hypothetical protein [Deltaproteobacteria bacterium]